MDVWHSLADAYNTHIYKLCLVSLIYFFMGQTATKKIHGNIRDENQFITALSSMIRLDKAEYDKKATKLLKLDKQVCFWDGISGAGGVNEYSFSSTFVTVSEVL